MFFGAGDGSRTRVTSLENWNNSRYMTPASEEHNTKVKFCIISERSGCTVVHPRIKSIIQNYQQ